MRLIAFARSLGWLCAFGLSAAASAQTVPHDEASRVAQINVDAATGNFISIDPSAQARGPGTEDESASVAAIVVDPVAGSLTTPHLQAPRSRGALDRTAEANDTSVDAAAGNLNSAPTNSSAQGAVDHSARVALTNVDAATGNLVSAPGNSTSLASQGAGDHTANVAASVVDAVAGTLTTPPAQLALLVAVPALALWSSLALAALLVIARWRSASG